MINLSAFGYEKRLKNPSRLFSSTWNDKSFINGKSVKDFEQKFQTFCNAQDCVAVSSCTSALHLSLLALSVGPGDEVITSPFTWVSTVEVIRQVGAKVVYADIKDDFTLDPVDVKNKITSATKAIILVDLFGLPCDVDAFMKLGPIVIQDAAQSTGAIYKRKRIGGIAHLTCFSFYPTKNLSCWGDAGAVTGNKEYIDVIKKLRNHGQEKRFDIKMVGWNARMDSIHAEVLLNKLPRLDEWNKRRREIAHRYNEELQGIVDTPQAHSQSIHVYHQYVIMSMHKDKIQSALSNRNIQSRTYYPIPLHQTTVYKGDGHYPKAELASLNNLAIPVHQYLTDKEVGLIIKTIKQAI
tara:strand:+ start:1677 stop:2732 length:1056 start_codon:yes stop_codon:yes gene_type:complete